MLNGPSNSIGALGSLSVGGNLTLVDAAALSVLGDVSGSLHSTFDLQTTGTGNTIAIGASGTPGTLQVGSLGEILLTAAGAIGEPNGGIVAGTLSASAGGSVALGAAVNTIGFADGITASGGDLVLASAGTMLLGGTLAGANLTVSLAAAGGTLELGGASLSANTAGRISLVADTLTAAAGARLNASGGTLELAPYSAEPFSLGQSGGTLSLNGTALPAFSAGVLAIGGITGTPLASAVTINAAIDLTASGVTMLDLLSLGTIGDAAALRVGTLQVDAGSHTVSLGSTLSSITTIGSLTAGNVTLGDSVGLTLDGPVSATSGTFNVPTLSEASAAVVEPGHAGGQRDAVRPHLDEEQHHDAGVGDAGRRPDAVGERRADGCGTGECDRRDAVGGRDQHHRQPRGRCHHRDAGAGQRRHGERERRHTDRRHADRQRHDRRGDDRRRSGAERRQQQRQQHRDPRQPDGRGQSDAGRYGIADGGRSGRRDQRDAVGGLDRAHRQPCGQRHQRHAGAGQHRDGERERRAR